MLEDIYRIVKTKDLNESVENISNDNFSDYELYQILEMNGYKTTDKNLQILKEGLKTGKFDIALNEFFNIRSKKDKLKKEKEDKEKDEKIQREFEERKKRQTEVYYKWVSILHGKEHIFGKDLNSDKEALKLFADVSVLPLTRKIPPYYINSAKAEKYKYVAIRKITKIFIRAKLEYFGYESGGPSLHIDGVSVEIPLDDLYDSVDVYTPNDIKDNFVNNLTMFYNTKKKFFFTIPSTCDDETFNPLDGARLLKTR